MRNASAYAPTAQPDGGCRGFGGSSLRYESKEDKNGEYPIAKFSYQVGERKNLDVEETECRKKGVFTAAENMKQDHGRDSSLQNAAKGITRVPVAAFPKSPVPM